MAARHLIPAIAQSWADQPAAATISHFRRASSANVKQRAAVPPFSRAFAVRPGTAHRGRMSPSESFHTGVVADFD